MVKARQRILAERISHERELRLAERAAFDHERELRAVFDAHERELRLAAEAAVEKARDIQFHEYERRLSDLNNSHERALREAARVVSQDSFEVYKESTRRELGLALDAKDKELDVLTQSLRETNRVIDRLQGSISTWRAIALFLGTTGVGGVIYILLTGAPKP